MSFAVLSCRLTQEPPEAPICRGMPRLIDPHLGFSVHRENDREFGTGGHVLPECGPVALAGARASGGRLWGRCLAGPLHLRGGLHFAVSPLKGPVFEVVFEGTFSRNPTVLPCFATCPCEHPNPIPHGHVGRWKRCGFKAVLVRPTFKSERCLQNQKSLGFGCCLFGYGFHGGNT